MLVEFVFLLIILGIGTVIFLKGRKGRRLRYIEAYVFPSSIRKRVQKTYPHLDTEQMNRVMEGLRTYFYICSQANNRMVAMPSQVVDVAWHEFIIFTRSYKQFSRKAFGRFLHHTPTEAMRSPTIAQDGIKRAWRLSCAKENIDMKAPAKLPLLFALDIELGIEDGFKYAIDCTSSKTRGDYCAGHIGCASGCGGSGCGGGTGGGGSLFGDNDGGGSGCGSGCGGGD